MLCRDSGILTDWKRYGRYIREDVSIRSIFGANAVLLIGMKTVTLFCGMILTALTYRAYRRIRAPAMRVLCLGIGLVTPGALLDGSLHQLARLPMAQSVTVEELFTAAGFFILPDRCIQTSRPRRLESRALGGRVFTTGQQCR